MDLNMQRMGKDMSQSGDRNKTEPLGTVKGPEARTMCNASELLALGANMAETAVRASGKRQLTKGLGKDFEFHSKRIKQQQKN